SKEAKEAARKALAKLPKGREAREKKAAEELAKNYDGRFSRMAKIEPLEPSESFFNALASVFDPHTRYLAPAEKDNFDIQMSGSLEGIGAVLSEDDHYIRVQEIVPGGASFRQGKLKAGDLILAVAQDGEEPVDVADMRINQVVQMIRGPKGTVVTLTVKKPDDSIEIIAITRDVVQIEAAYARGAVIDGPDGGKLGYVSLASFYGNTRARPGRTPQRNSSDDLRRLFLEMEKRKVPGVILDLRGNGGGLLDHARQIAGLFIPTGPVVQTRYPKEDSQVLSDDDPAVVYTGQVVVLVNRFSASASEIVAGALQDYQRAVVVGTGPTHGKGTVQMIFDLNRLRGAPGLPLGVLKLTIQQFYRINGESTQFRGVVPDVLLPDPVGHLESRERDLDNAIPWDKVDPLQYSTWSGKSWKLPELTARSKTRVAGNQLFKKIMERSAYLDGRRKQTKVPLQRDKWLARRKADREALEKADPKLDEAPAVLKPQVINYTGKLKKVDRERIKAWKKSVSRDPWLNEARNILADMLGQSTSVTNTGSGPAGQ
ncbi:MAG: carboxy terminal-processing peptidase, partial [Deltaproteobacteria bacterium]|nr:carboxy terminal-processing peptidase [Deltaproteobacteria bacterium]